LGSLPRTTEAQVIGKQLLRSATSVASNYRAAGRARSPAEFVSKIGIVVEEADESQFWLECLSENGIVRSELLADLLGESDQLVRIFSASQQTAKNSSSKN
jgi:four helix bundle protein